MDTEAQQQIDAADKKKEAGQAGTDIGEQESYTWSKLLTESSLRMPLSIACGLQVVQQFSGINAVIISNIVIMNLNLCYLCMHIYYIYMYVKYILYCILGYLVITILVLHEHMYCNSTSGFISVITIHITWWGHVCNVLAETRILCVLGGGGGRTVWIIDIGSV